MATDGPDIADPFTQVYDWLYDNLLKRSHALGIVLKSGNVVSFNTAAGLSARNNEPRDSDLPEIQLASSSVSGNLNLTSDSVQVFRLYQFLCTSRPGALGKTIYPLEWALTCAMTDANYDAGLRALTWQGQQFVAATALEAGQSGESNPELNRGIGNAWAAIWGINVHMIFARRSMQQFNQGVPVDQIQV